MVNETPGKWGVIDTDFFGVSSGKKDYLMNDENTVTE